jgi:hypothetical protein
MEDFRHAGGLLGFGNLLVAEVGGFIHEAGAKNREGTILPQPDTPALMS